MNNVPFFAVIIPLYNKESYLQRSFSSVKKQTFNDYEVIIVDDGSTDGSYKAAELLKEECWNLVRQRNQGVSCARNQGVFLSNAQYVCFLDADDEWHPRFLEKMYALTQKFPGAGLYGAGYEVIINKKRITGRYGIFKKNGKCNLFLEWLLRIPVHTDGQAIPRNVFEEMKGFVPGQRFYEDATLMFRIALKHSVVVTREVLTRYYAAIPESACEKMLKERPLYPAFLTCIDQAYVENNSFWFRAFVFEQMIKVCVSATKPRRKGWITQLYSELKHLSFAYKRMIFFFERFPVFSCLICEMFFFFRKCFNHCFYKSVPIEGENIQW